MKKHLLIFVIAVGVSMLNSCVSVKPWQKMYLNDADMTLGPMRSASYELNAENYREGASGANGAKSGGGCGCN